MGVAEYDERTDTHTIAGVVCKWFNYGSGWALKIVKTGEVVGSAVIDMSRVSTPVGYIPVVDGHAIGGSTTHVQARQAIERHFYVMWMLGSRPEPKNRDNIEGTE